MALDSIARTRIIMDLVKDGDVAVEGDYAGLDLASAAHALAIADAYIERFGPVLDDQGTEIPNPTNVQKAQFYLNAVRGQHRRTIIHSVKEPQVEAAIVAATATANATANTILGADEPL